MEGTSICTGSLSPGQAVPDPRRGATPSSQTVCSSVQKRNSTTVGGHFRKCGNAPCPGAPLRPIVPQNPVRSGRRFLNRTSQATESPYLLHDYPPRVSRFDWLSLTGCDIFCKYPKVPQTASSFHSPNFGTMLHLGTPRIWTNVLLQQHTMCRRADA